jgi:hypothetical protein
VKLPHKSEESQFFNVCKNYHHRDHRARRVSQCLEKMVQKVPIFENFWSRSFQGLEGRPPQLPKNDRVKNVPDFGDLLCTAQRAAREVFQG